MKKVVTLLLILTLLVPTLSGYAMTNEQWIRVGLKTYYENVDKISIHNTNIKLGFGAAAQYTPEVLLRSSTGFVVTPTNSFYCISNSNYSNYMDAKYIADQLNEMGIPSIPGLAAQGIWKLYVGESYDLETANYTHISVEGVLGLSFHVAEDNGQRIKITGDQFVIISDNAAGYIQVIPAKDDEVMVNPTTPIESDNQGTQEPIENDINEQPDQSINQEGQSNAQEEQSNVQEDQSNAQEEQSNVQEDQTIPSVDPEVIHLGTRSYRGRIELGRYREVGITAINEVNLEEYLFGVVPSEIVPSWPVESLKTQAVAARTYAMYYLTTVNKYPNEAYDVCDTTNSQSYKGYKNEHLNTTEAVRATKGEMIYYNDKVIATYYSAASGGRTESIKNVWSSNASYYQSVPDIYETEPSRRPWLVTITKAELKTKLEARGVFIGEITDMVIGSYSDAGRPLLLEIIGTDGTHTLTKENIRTWLGLYSSKFKLVKVNTDPVKSLFVTNDGTNLIENNLNDLFCLDGSGELTNVQSVQNQLIVVGGTDIVNYPLVTATDDEFILAGQGWGHGVGMSQSGARGMASNGYNYKQILMHYYTGTIVK